jgi:hypothetical protein
MHQVPRTKSEGRCSCVCRWVALRGVFANCRFSAIERSLVLHVALEDIPRNASSLLVKATTTVLSSNPMKLESCVERTRSSRSNFVMPVQSTPPMIMTMLSLPIRPVQNRHRAQLQQDNDASERPNGSTTSTLGLQGSLTLYLTFVNPAPSDQQHTDNIV